ncbi:Kelch domain-containing protein 10 [Blattella germanica]|nr:Kelch domain-containing protein 10 [Blattella germanica]
MSNTTYKFKPFIFVKRGPNVSNKCRAPYARSGHRVVCDEKNLYSFGGYNPALSNDTYLIEDSVWQENRPLFKELWKYNFASRIWTRLSCSGSIPNELASSAVLLKGGTMIIYGGTGYPFGAQCSNQLHVCNFREDYKIQPVKAEGSFPPQQYGQALILDGSYLYTVGGTTGFDYTADVHRLDLRTGIWEEIYICTGKVYGEPKGRYRHELAFDGTKIYLLGGGTADLEIPAFNLSTGLWENLVTRCDPDAPPVGVPAPRRCHGCVQMPGNGHQQTSVFICGGYDGEEIFRDVWRLELQTLQWTRMLKSSFPRAVYFHSVAITPAGCMYSFGGITESQNNTKRTADVYRAWMCIPKLAEICWEAILHYNPNLYQLPKDKLLNYGLPSEYVNRID